MALAPSSPRLPSPPPPAEIQMTPNSPSGGPAATLETNKMEQSLLDANSKRRIHPGTKAADMAAGPPLVPLSELESAFSLQEHLAALHYNHTAQGTRALTRVTAHQIAQPPAGIDRTLWLYELCRFLISQCNTLIVGFLFDTPPCSANTCPEMRASEWQFLCAVHEQPKSCCAIDYCCHTLDWAANVVSDQNIFPSRFVILNDTQSKNVGLKNLVNVFRRLHRIFAHAWFQHRSVFWAVEGQSGLYVLFKTVCDLYDLLPAENYKLPPEAEGLETPELETEAAAATSSSIPTILKANSPPRQGGSGTTSTDDNLQPHGRITTRRHIRNSPSTGSAVTTVMETDEEDTDAVSRSMSSMRLETPPNLSQFADEPEIAEVTFMVKESPQGKVAQRLTAEAKSRADGEQEATEAAGPVEGGEAVRSAVDSETAKTAEPEAKGSHSTALAASEGPLTGGETAPAEPCADPVAGEGAAADATDLKPVKPGELKGQDNAEAGKTTGSSDSSEGSVPQAGPSATEASTAAVTKGGDEVSVAETGDAVQGQ